MEIGLWAWEEFEGKNMFRTHFSFERHLNCLTDFNEVRIKIFSCGSIRQFIYLHYNTLGDVFTLVEWCTVSYEIQLNKNVLRKRIFELSKVSSPINLKVISNSHEGHSNKNSLLRNSQDTFRLSQLKGLSRSSFHLQRLGNGKPATEFLAHAQPVPRL